MDQQNPLKHIDCFSVPNSQTGNPVDLNSNLAATSPGDQPPSLWDPASLSNDVSDEPSVTPTGLPLEFFAQSPSPGASIPLASSMRPPPYGQSKTVLPTRAPHPRTREGHERKRSKLSADASNNMDSVDFWLEFDGDGGPATAQGNDSKGKDRASSGKRTHTGADPLCAPTGGGLATGTGMTPGSGFKPEHDDVIDDSALDNALSDEDDGLSSMNLIDQLSKIDSAPPTDVPPREGLYSTPLSWEKPQPGLRMDPLLSLHNAPLNESDQQRLIAIAMNPGPTTGGLGSSLANEYAAQFGSHAFGAPLMPSITTMSQLTNFPSQSISNFQPSMSQPSASSVTASGTARGSAGEKGKEKEKAKTGDRTAHNDIERKYRTNLKDRIAELRDSVPALRPIPENGVPNDDDGAAQPGRAPKVSKGTVLTKATEYIHFLERKNKAILREHQELSRRLQAFEQLLNATARQPYSMPNHSRTLFDPRGFC